MAINLDQHRQFLRAMHESADLHRGWMIAHGAVAPYYTAEQRLLAEIKYYDHVIEHPDTDMQLPGPRRRK